MASSYTIDGSNPPAVDAQGNAPSIQGAVYQASAWVKGTAATGHRTVGLVVRETNPSGGLVSDKESQVKLSAKRFKKVGLAYQAVADGDSIDVYVRRADGWSPTTPSASTLSPGPVRSLSTRLPTTRRPDPPSRSSARRSPGRSAAVDPSGERARYHESDRPGELRRGRAVGRAGIQLPLHHHPRLDARPDPGATGRQPQRQDPRLQEPRLRQPSAQRLPLEPLPGQRAPWCDATAHESWFLHDTSGNRLESDYQDVFAANVANAGYQQAWINDVEARLTDVNADGSGARYDGVFIDDTNLFPGHGLNGRIAELSDPQYGQAVKGFIQTVGDQLKADGFITMPNLGLQTWDSTQRSQALDIASHVTAINRETFVRWGSGDLFTTPPSNGTPDWRDELKLESDIQATGADYSAIVYGAPDDVQAQRYAGPRSSSAGTDRTAAR